MIMPATPAGPPFPEALKQFNARIATASKVIFRFFFNVRPAMAAGSSAIGISSRVFIGISNTGPAMAHGSTGGRTMIGCGIGCQTYVYYLIGGSKKNLRTGKCIFGVHQVL